MLAMAMSARGTSRHFAARPNFVTMGAWRRGRTAIWIYENRVAFPVTATTVFLAPDILNKCGPGCPRRVAPSKGPVKPIGGGQAVTTWLRHGIDLDATVQRHHDGHRPVTMSVSGGRPEVMGRPVKATRLDPIWTRRGRGQPVRSLR